MSTIMVQGTCSDAGKSTIVAGLCRVLRRRGRSVAPFKPQNMALNAAVTVDGGEIGRAQALQARACGLEPTTDMNPVLLKPESDTGAQVVVHGKAVGVMDARAYQVFKPRALAAALESHTRLIARFDVIVAEGAGSPAEVNLREGDLANMGFAEAVDCPVLLVADIARGGVFAQVVGTLELLASSERARVRGVVVNRFKGDRSLLEPGLRWLEDRTAVPILGVLPHLGRLLLDAEDAVDVRSSGEGLRVVILRFPRISNHDDFDPLRAHPQVSVRFLGAGEALPAADLVILPGSKNVRADLAWLRAQGWEDPLLRHVRYGGKVLGICGGYQMLGMTVDDPLGVEGPPGSSAGLGLLDVRTRMEPDKRLSRVAGRLVLGDALVVGYEIHAGMSEPVRSGAPLVVLSDGRSDGALSADRRVAGTYLHGLCDRPEALDAILRWAGLEDPAPLDREATREAELDRLADAVEAHLDVDAVEALCQLRPRTVGWRPGERGRGEGRGISSPGQMPMQTYFVSRYSSRPM